jgi:hypothetical protein
MAGAKGEVTNADAAWPGRRAKEDLARWPIGKSAIQQVENLRHGTSSDISDKILAYWNWRFYFSGYSSDKEELFSKHESSHQERTQTGFVARRRPEAASGHQ